ncbi:MAG: DUF2478 domain-containing protein [Pseudomonadota bacterium]
MRPSEQRLAAVRYQKGFEIDALLVEVCRGMAESGVRLGGLLQISEGGVGGCATSVKLYDLQTKTVFDIWEVRGPCARGCRLDESGLNAAAAVLERAISDRVELLVINRFGRAESLGRGLLPYFVRAMEAGIPVLTGVRTPYDDAWVRFHDGLGRELACDTERVLGWATRVGHRLAFATCNDLRDH